MAYVLDSSAEQQPTETVTTVRDSLTLVEPDRSVEAIDPFEHEVFADRLIHEAKGIGITLENVVDGDDAEFMWEMYNRGFSALNASTLSRQTLDKEEFLEELGDPTVIKYMARNKSGVPVGYMAVEKGLNREDASPYWPQQDDELLQAVQDSEDIGAPSFYISSFLVDKESDEYMLKTSQIILEGALLHFRDVCGALNTDSLCFFDFAPDNSFLPTYIERASKPNDTFGGSEVVIWPVYVAEWYKLPIDAFVDQESLDRIIENLPEDAFSDSEGFKIEDGVPLEIQPENLEGDTSDYVTVTNVSTISVAVEKILSSASNGEFDGKKSVLIHLKRLGSVQDPCESLGERLSYQSFVAQQLKK